MKFSANHVEENADDLIKRLEGQGKKVKIINDDDEEEIQTQENFHRQTTDIQNRLKEIDYLEKEKNNINAEKEQVESELTKKEEMLKIE